MATGLKISIVYDFETVSIGLFEYLDHATNSIQIQCPNKSKFLNMHWLWRPSYKINQSNII
jgi:hypothetical protein